MLAGVHRMMSYVDIMKEGTRIWCYYSYKPGFLWSQKNVRSQRHLNHRLDSAQGEGGTSAIRECYRLQTLASICISFFRSLKSDVIKMVTNVIPNFSASHKKTN